MAIINTTPQISGSCLDIEKISNIARELLLAIGEDPDREGLKDTPQRYANWWQEFIEYDPGQVDTTFESVSTDQMVVVSGIKVWSLCEHHLLPFWCNISIGYIAGDKVLGLSKFARIANDCAHRLQLQERLVHQIADNIEQLTDSSNVAVLGQGTHFCMVIRGIKSQGVMSTSVVRGQFRDPEVRQEFFNMIDRAQIT